jgi:hypothetical protein
LPSPRNTLYPQRLAVTSPTYGGRSVGILRLRTKVTEFSLSHIKFQRHVGKCLWNTYLNCAFIALCKLDFIIIPKIGVEWQLLVEVSHIRFQHSLWNGLLDGWNSSFIVAYKLDFVINVTENRYFPISFKRVSHIVNFTKISPDTIPQI